jgi:microcin C transport system permease protein
LVLSKLPVSITLGLWSFILVYAVSIPLGIKKAVNDGSRFDILSSTIVLIGYSIPGFVLGIGLIVLLGGGSFFDVFPTRGIISDNWAELNFFGKITDYLWHITLPVICLVIGSFAVMTMLTKNSFIDEINKSYVVTARSKGLSENKVLYSHVFKNAIIPILTGFPAQFVSAFFTGSILIETIFSLDGIGLLSYEAIIQRDYPVVMGTLFIFTLIGLITKLITDIMYVYVDPRIKFSSSDTQRNS